MANETVWTINTSSNAGHASFSVSNQDKYTFGFTGFKSLHTIDYLEDEPDPFDTWVHEVRKENGIVDPEPEPVRRPPRPVGQVLWSGVITIPSPRYTGTLRGITSYDEPTGSDNSGD